MEKKIITPEQCKIGRTLLKWSQEELSKKLGVNKKTVADFERGATTPYNRTLKDIYNLFSDYKIQFIDDKNHFGAIVGKKEKNQIKISQNNLVVIKAFLLGSEFKELVSKKHLSKQFLMIGQIEC